MKILVKLGGTLLDVDETRQQLSKEIAGVMAEGHQVVVVHGGGKQMTRFLEERGVESRFLNGLRVTTPEVVDAVLKVLCGSVNQQLVSTLVSAGCEAVGLSGIDANLTEAEPINQELGAVGKPVRSNPKVLDVLVQAGMLPVVACVAGDRDGNIYNVNADQMAAACAAAFHADRLFFLTDVEGVRGGSGTCLDLIDSDECKRLIANGIATGGMQAKLNACVEAVNTGVGEVVVALGAKPGILHSLLKAEKVGTRIHA